MTKVSKAIRRSRKDRVEIRQENAVRRNADWKSLSPEKQLADLDARLGKGVGAAKQRAKLQSRIDSQPVKRQKQEEQPPVQEAQAKVKKETKKKA